jgi:hypothetical protein
MRNNKDRYASGERILVDYATETVGVFHDEDDITTAGDMMADLMHYLGRSNFKKALRSAWMHYNAEISGE